MTTGLFLGLLFADLSTADLLYLCEKELRNSQVDIENLWSNDFSNEQLIDSVDSAELLNLSILSDTCLV